MPGPFAIGQVIEKWEISEVLREGSLPRYAVKGPLGTGVLSFFSLEESGARELLARAKRSSGVQHANLLRTPVGEAGGGAIAIVPDVDQLGDDAMPPEEALEFLAQLTQIVQAFHAKKRAHGELDAFTVRRRNGEAVLLPPGVDLPSPELSTLRLAVDPRYASPEVLDARPATPASDVFSLGMILYKLVTGQHPVSGSSLEAFVARGQTPVPRIEKGRTLPAGVTSLYANMTAAESLRPRHAGELLKLIERAKKKAVPLPERPKATVKRKTVGGLLTVVVLLLLLIAGGVYFLHSQYTIGSPAEGFEFSAPSSE